jgi:hypothetical protein
MLQVEVDIPLHNVLVIGSCDILLDLCLSKILLFPILHLCININLLAVHCIEVLDYNRQGYIVAAQCCIVAAHCFTATTHFCMEVVPS